MLKRFYSKRSGFTLVEIIVAFAVFAIMAGMIAQILNLAVNARNYNNEYARALSSQEKVLTILQKSSEDYDASGATGELVFDFNGTTLPPIAYQTKSAADPRELTSAEGLNYFLSPVDYGGENETPTADPSGGSNTGSQMARMDTRITGTANIGHIIITHVIKDTHTSTNPADPNYLAPGRTRYFIRCAASLQDINGKETFRDENVPYAQFRLYFYCEPEDETDTSYIDAAKRDANPETDEDGKTYTKDYHKAAKVVKVGYLKRSASDAGTNGLQADYVGTEVNNQCNYSVMKSGDNAVRIGSPFVTGDPDGVNINGQQMGKKFSEGKPINFYVEFEGDDPHLTTASFGHNGVPGVNADGTSIRTNYYACPEYNGDDYDIGADGVGTPKYTSDDYLVNIYGAYLYTRHYN